MVKKKKCTTLVSDVDKRGGYAYRSLPSSMHSIWKISIPPSHFSCKPKTALEKLILGGGAKMAEE